MNNDTIIEKLWTLRELLSFGYSDNSTSAIQLLDEIIDDIENSELEDEAEGMSSYDDADGLLSTDEYIDPYKNYKIKDCILNIPRFAKELVNTTSSTVNGYVLPSDVEQIIPAMRYTPTVLYLIVVTVLLDMGIPVVYNEVEMNAFDYTEFRGRLAKVLTCVLGADSDALAQNIYSVDEELDMYEDFVATIDDALIVSLKSAN